MFRRTEAVIRFRRSVIRFSSLKVSKNKTLDEYEE